MCLLNERLLGNNNNISENKVFLGHHINLLPPTKSFTFSIAREDFVADPLYL